MVSIHEHRNSGPTTGYRLPLNYDEPPPMPSSPECSAPLSRNSRAEMLSTLFSYYSLQKKALHRHRRWTVLLTKKNSSSPFQVSCYSPELLPNRPSSSLLRNTARAIHVRPFTLRRPSTLSPVLHKFSLPKNFKTYHKILSGILSCE